MTRAASWTAALALVGCAGSDPAPSVERLEERAPVVGLPCEGCEGVFVGLPDELSSRAVIARPDAGDVPLVIEGTVRDADGAPAAGVVIYAYHTDSRGVYPPSAALAGTEAERHGALRGWARTDAAGGYRFETLRPASYPDTTVPAHVHLHVLEPGRCTYWIDAIEFTDDPHLDDAEREGRGGSGLALPVTAADGSQRVRRDVVLGERVPGYPR